MTKGSISADDPWTRLSIPLLKAFSSVYAERSMTRAAIVLGLPQSTLSTTIAKLRTIYKDPLFVRGDGQLEPTSKAHEIASPISQALAQLEATLFSRTEFCPQQISAQFHIAMVDLVQFRLLPKLVELLSEEAPMVRLSVTNFVADSVEHHLASRQLDLAVASSLLSLRNVRFSRLYDEQFTCVIRKGHPFSRKEWTLAQFVSLGHIQVSPVGTSFVSVIDRVLAEHGTSRQIQHFVPTYSVAARIVERSDFVALMPVWIAAAISTNTYDIKIKSPPVALVEVPVIQLWHERSQGDPFHRWLRHRLVQISKDARAQD